MNSGALILIGEALVVYLLVLLTHALRHRVGLAPFYALLGGITAVMSWVTDAGVQVEVGGITFLVGSTVFYTALLLGVFVVYVFDGPVPTRTAILTVAGVSALVPVIAVVLHMQMNLTGHGNPASVPLPSLRINAASVLTTVADLVFLAMFWEFLGKQRPRIGLWSKAFVALLGVMWLDVLLFSTGAFFGRPEYLSIMKGTFFSRLAIATFAWPFLCAYLAWQTRLPGAAIQNRPVLAILREVAQVHGKLRLATQEIDRIREVERALRESEERFRVLFESSRDAIMTLEPPSWRFTSANPATVSMFKAANEQDLTAHEPWALSPERQPDGRASAEKAKAMIETAIREGSQFFEWTHRRINGESFPATVLLGRMEADGKALLQATVRDITGQKQAEGERRELEKELHEKQKLAAVGTLACGMGHEINNPIMGIINYAQLIKDRLQGKDGDVAEFAGEIVIEAERIAGIVRGLSAFATRDIATRAAVPVGDLIEFALSGTRATLAHDHVTLALDVPADLPAVSCDRGQIVEVLTGLLSNARDALNERYPGQDADKKIFITAKKLSSVNGHQSLEMMADTNDQGPMTNDAAKPSMTNDADRPIRAVRLTVEDHGTGIPAAVREHIFEPFFTTKDKSVGAGSIGKGLGLFVSYATVQEHGGALSVESPSTALPPSTGSSGEASRAGEGGRGARFHLDLPVV